MKRSKWPLILSLLTLLSGCTQGRFHAPAESAASMFAMNTYITMTAYGEAAQEALDGAKSRIGELEARLSVTDARSELYAVNHSGGKTVAVSEDTAAVTAFALDMAKRTGGALDPTIYPVLRAWGFTTDIHRIPEPSEIDELLRLAGYEQVTAAGREITLPDGMQLDLGAVAKGYAGDEVCAYLRKQGVSSAIISLGGNVQTIGTKPDGSLWRVGLQAPDQNAHIGVLETADCAVITSGSYQNYFTGPDGKRYHHIMDPATGYPANRGLLSATVVGKEGKLCDALSTALFVMGSEQAASYWRANDGFDMILLTDTNELYLTEGLEKTFQLNEEYASLSVTVLRR